MPQVHDVHEWVALNSAFHEKLLKGCNRRLLLEEIDRRRRQCEPLIRLYVGFLHRDQTAQRQHEAILDACRRQGAEEVETLVREHLTQTGQGIADAIRARKARTLNLATQGER
jgi:DNA-binding GntR family transcriptional regulator